MRHRDTGRGGAADAGADAGDDAEADAGGGERQRLLAAAAEHQRVAALQPHHAVAVARQADQALVDAKLRRAAPAGALADRLQPRLWGERQDLRRDQRVVQHDIGLGQGARGVQGEQARIAGTGADQPDGARLEGHASHPLACSSASVSAATSRPVRGATPRDGRAAERGGRPIRGRSRRPAGHGCARRGRGSRRRSRPSAAGRRAGPRPRCGSRTARGGPRRSPARARTRARAASSAASSSGRPAIQRARKRGEIGRPRQEVAQCGPGCADQAPSGWSENSSGACAPPARSACRRRAAAGPRPATASGKATASSAMGIIAAPRTRENTSRGTFEPRCCFVRTASATGNPAPRREVFSLEVQDEGAKKVTSSPAAMHCRRDGLPGPGAGRDCPWRLIHIAQWVLRKADITSRVAATLRVDASDRALSPSPESMICSPGRSAADGRLANPVRSGRKQPQRVSARVVRPASHPLIRHARGPPRRLESAPHVRPVPGRSHRGSRRRPDGPGLFGDARRRSRSTPRPIGCSPANTARPASTT